MAMRINGLNSGMDTESIVRAMTSTYSNKRDNLTRAQTKLEWTQNAWKDMNKQIYDFYSSTLSNARLSSGYSKATATVSDNIAKVTLGKNATTANQSLKVKSLMSSGYLTGAMISGSGRVTSTSKMSDILGGVGYPGTVAVTVNGEVSNITMTDDMTVSQFLSKIQGTGLKASFDENNQRFYIFSGETGDASNFTIAAADTEAENTLNVLGLTSTDAVYIKGKDAEIELNGVNYASSSNHFDINGLGIDVTNVSENNKISTIAVSNKNSEDLYKNITDFFDKYNSLMKSMNKAYNAKSSKGYEPLLEDEKSAMSDSQIDKWESNIKESLLRKDSTLYSIMNTFKNGTMKSYTVDGEKMSLAAIGITTGNYFSTAADDRGTYSIDEEKLKSALDKDPDKVISFMQNLAKGIYDDVTNKMKSTSMSSAYTIYNDKQMSKQFSDYTNKISQWDKKIAEYEDKYYKQFAQMEKMMAKLNSQSSYMSNFFGM